MLFDKVVIVLCVSTFTISWTRPLPSDRSLTETDEEPFFLKDFSWFTPTPSKSPTHVKKDNVSEASTSKVQAERESTYEKNALAWSIFNTGYFSEESKSSEPTSTDVDYIYEESTTRLPTSAAKDFSITSEGTSSELRSMEEDYSKDESTTPVVTTTTEDYFPEEVSSSELTATEIDHFFDEPSTSVSTSTTDFFPTEPTSSELIVIEEDYVNKESTTPVLPLTTENYFPEEVSSSELTATEIDHFFDEPSTSVPTSTTEDFFYEGTSAELTPSTADIHKESTTLFPVPVKKDYVSKELISLMLTSTAQDSFEESTSSIRQSILDNEFSNKTVQAPSKCAVGINLGFSCVLSNVLVICLCTLALLLLILCTLFKIQLPIFKNCQGEDGLKDSDVELSNVRKDNNN